MRERDRQPKCMRIQRPWQGMSSFSWKRVVRFGQSRGAAFEMLHWAASPVSPVAHPFKDEGGTAPIMRIARSCDKSPQALCSTKNRIPTQTTHFAPSSARHSHARLIASTTSVPTAVSSCTDASPASASSPREQSIRVDALYPFPGYRPIEVGSTHFGPRPELFPTLEHFYQSERFRGSDGAVRARVLNAPSAHEARKIAMAHQRVERSDWLAVHERIMLCGLWMMLREHPRLAKELSRSDLSKAAPFPYRDMYWGNDRPGASKDRFRALLGQIRHRLEGNTTRVLVCGSRTFANPFLLSSKLDALLTKSPPDVVLIGGDTGTDEMVEHWAISRQLPVRHMLYRGKRTTSEARRHHRALVGASTHIVIFDQSEANSAMFAEIAVHSGKPMRSVKINVDGSLERASQRA